MAETKPSGDEGPSNLCVRCNVNPATMCVGCHESAEHRAQDVTIGPAPEPKPHGPVSERFMRHHYGASGAKRG